MKPAKKKEAPQPVDERDEQIKTLKEDNASLAKTVAELEKANSAGSKQVSELSQDILDIHDSLSNLFLRTQRVMDRYHIGTRVSIEKGEQPVNGLMQFLKDIGDTEDEDA